MPHFLRTFLILLLPAVLRADVVINEIMYHPASERTTEEYIELHNTGAAAVNLSGWKLSEAVSFTFPNVTIVAGGYLVIAADSAAFAAKYPGVTNVVSGWKGRLSNSADTIVLEDGSGVKVDEVDYADDGDWAVRQRDDLDHGHRGWRWRSDADGFGKSLELINATFDNAIGQNWGASVKAEGTPGAVNSIAATDIAPVITEVRHFPLVPTSTQTVTVTARVVDDRAASATVTVNYRREGVATWSTMPMVDDGAHADGLAGDRVFGAQLPAEANGTIVEFHISATDGSRARTWPAPAQNNTAPGAPFTAEQSQNCLYQVDDAGYAGVMPVYRLVMKAADYATLENINYGDGTESHARFNATFITIDGTGTELRYLNGVRNRGHGSASLQPQSFNIAIPNDWDWKGRTSLNFNSQYTYLQLLGSAFMRRAGMTASESRPVQLRVNNVDPTSASSSAPSYGFYVCNEVHDSVFADHHFPNDSSGNLYSVRRTDSLPYHEGDLSYLTPAGLNGADPYRLVYFKETNAAEDNWTDLIALTQALAKGRSTTLLATPTWDADYIAAVQAKVDVTQWMTWFAAESLIANRETSFANGYGDDYSLYIGVDDPRAQLIPFDLDTILGDGDDPANPTDDIFLTIRHGSDRFPALTPTPVYPFLRHPQLAPIYFAKLQDLLKGPLSVANFNLLADQLLTGVMAPTRIADRKAWYAARHAHVSGLVQLRLSVTSGPAVDAASGYAMSRTPTCSLAGKSDPARTQNVKVNGVDAAYVPWKVASVGPGNAFTVAIGEWSLADVALQPGINRILIQAFDAAGAEIERVRHEVWYDDTSVSSVAGALATNTTWTAAGGPYLVNGPLTINSGVTLTIEPGTTIYLGAGVGITVAGGGRLLAEGTEAKPIHFTRAPGATGNGGTLVINGAPGAPETHLYHVFFNFGGDPAVACEANSNVVLDFCEWLRTDVPYLHLDGASFVVSNCIFPNSAPGYFFEAIHGDGATPAGGRAIIRDSFFGKTHSTRGDYNDVIDFTSGNRPGPILQLYNNVFVGSDDDVLDLDGTDAWIEGNIFMHVHRVGSPDSASAISGGAENGQNSEITIVGNIFYDVDQAVTAKESNFYTFLNNTVVDQNSRGSEDRLEDITNRPEIFRPAVFNFGDDGIPHAAGMYIEGNVIHSAEKLARNYTGAERVTLNNNLLPFGMAWTGPGGGNTSTDALLGDVSLDAATGVSSLPTPTKDNYRQVAAEIRRQLALDARSPGRDTGLNGADKGGARPIGVSLRGIPNGTTNATSASITVGSLLSGSSIPAGAAQFPGGSGWTHYKWRIDGGAWSGETAIATPITLAGLANGTHTLEVAGKNDAGSYQDSADLGGSARVSSATWRVDTSFVPPAPGNVRINEVLANNTTIQGFGGTFPDIVELTNVGSSPVDLGGWGLTDSASQPYKYTIPNGTTLAPGAYLVIYASSSATVPSPKTGFALGAGGDDLTLTRSPAAGGGTADRVSWGQQIADFSIGRAGDGSWILCRPTFGSANLPAAQSPATGVRINEWLASATSLFGDDFIELYNPGTMPVDIGGYFLTDNPVGWPNRSAIPPLTFIAARGFVSFKADGDVQSGPDHVDFHLSAQQGEIGLISPSLRLVDAILYGSQRTDISRGRAPDGSDAISGMLPTPGAANRLANADRDGDGMPDAWEIEHGFDPNNVADGMLDADGDGQSNLAEYLAGTNPRDAKDFKTPRSPDLPRVARLVNLSVLAPLSQGEVMTIGVAMGGAGTVGAKGIVVRAAGPALTQFGVNGVLPDPTLALINQASGATIATNNDWAGDPTLSAVIAQVGAFPFGSAGSKDAGLSQPALPATNYTVQVRDNGNGSGTVIAELYDATPSTAFTATTPRLINVSLLKQLAPQTTLTVGFVIDGPTSKNVLVRAVGPSLSTAPFNVPGTLEDPRLTLFDNATSARINENNDWGGSAALSAGFASVGAFALSNPSTKDAALLLTLAPGQYSIQVAGAEGSGGLVLVEIYEVP